MNEREKKDIINRIIYWLNEIDEIKAVREWIMKSESGKNNPILRKTTTISLLWGWQHMKEYEIPENVTILIMDGFKRSIEHLTELIENSDKELVTIAKAIYNGEIDKEGR